MAIVVKPYLDRGLSVTLGILGVSESRATVPFTVEGLDGDTGDTAQANAAYLAAYAGAFPEDSTLPLRSITSRIIRPTVAIGVAVYARREGVTIPTVPAHLLSSGRTGVTYLKYHRSDNSKDADGRPDGTLDIGSPQSGLRVGKTHQFKANMRTIFVPTVLSAVPTIALDGYVDCVNSVAIKLSGMMTQNGGDTSDEQFPANTLWFVGYSYSPVELNGEVMFKVVYQFNFLDTPGWEQEQLNFAGASVDNETSYTNDVLNNYRISTYIFAKDVIDFTGLFPTHVPVT